MNPLSTGWLRSPLLTLAVLVLAAQAAPAQLSAEGPPMALFGQSMAPSDPLIKFYRNPSDFLADRPLWTFTSATPGAIIRNLQPVPRRTGLLAGAYAEQGVAGVYVFDMNQGGTPVTFVSIPLPGVSATRLTFSTDGTHLYMLGGAYGGPGMLWDIDTVQWTIAGSVAAPSSITGDARLVYESCGPRLFFAPDNWGTSAWVFDLQRGANGELLDISQASAPRSLAAPTGAAALDKHPDRERLWMAGHGSLAVYDIAVPGAETQLYLSNFPGPNSLFPSLAFHYSGATAFMGQDNWVYYLDPDSLPPAGNTPPGVDLDTLGYGTGWQVLSAIPVAGDDYDYLVVTARNGGAPVRIFVLDATPPGLGSTPVLSRTLAWQGDIVTVAVFDTCVHG